MPSYALFIECYQVAILVDDMIDSGKTLQMATRALRENGAKSVYALISHGTLITLSIKGWATRLIPP